MNIYGVRQPRPTNSEMLLADDTVNISLGNARFVRLIIFLHSLPTPKYMVPEVEVKIDTRASMRELRSRAHELLRSRFQNIYFNNDPTNIVFPSCEYNNTHIGRQDNARLIDVMGWDVSQFTRINAKFHPLAVHVPAAPLQPSMVSHAPAKTAPASAVAEPTTMTTTTLAIVPTAMASTVSTNDPSSPPPHTPKQPSTSSANSSTSKHRQKELTEMLNEMRKKMRVLKEELRQMYDSELRQMEGADDNDSP